MLSNYPLATWMRSARSESGWRAIISWWESRRLAYNVIIGCVALISFPAYSAALSACGKIRPGQDLVEPLALFLAPIAANAAYTGGWLFEVAWAQFFGERRALGPALFVAGTLFSICIVLFPSVFWIVAWLRRP